MLFVPFDFDDRADDGGVMANSDIQPCLPRETMGFAALNPSYALSEIGLGAPNSGLLLTAMQVSATVGK